MRTVLVPHGRAAHGLRRELLRLGRPEGLAGTRFVTVAGAAAAVLRTAETSFTAGEESMREARLAALFREALPLERFDIAQLRSSRGWEEAFARTLRDLEAQGFGPRDLLVQAGPRERDVATLWAAAERAAGSSVTTPRLLREAASVLTTTPTSWPFEGPTLAVVAGDLTVAERDFLLAVPRVTLGLLAARPRTPEYLARMEALLGAEVADALRNDWPPEHAFGPQESTRTQPQRGIAPSPAPSTTAPESDATPEGAAPEEVQGDLSRLGSRLFEAPVVLADQERSSSAKGDGAVRLELHGCMDEELDAAAAWVSEAARETPLDEIALLVPAIEPWAALLKERLERASWPLEGGVPLYVAGGLPMAQTVFGARMLALVRALQEHLPLARLAELLPTFRLPGRDPLSPSEASEVVAALIEVGGGPEDLSGAMGWVERVGGRGDEARIALLRAARQPLLALANLARLSAEGGPLRQIWPALRTLAQRWLQAPSGEAALDAAHVVLAPQCTDPATGALRGEAALAQVARTLRTCRVPAGRCGDRAVFIGTPRQARGMRFDATRLLGLTDGVVPAPSEVDPVLPGRLTVRNADLSTLHDLDRAVRDTRRTLILSAARRDRKGLERGPSVVLQDVAAALGRPLVLSPPAVGQGAAGPSHASVSGEAATDPGGDALDVARVLALLASDAWDAPISPGAGPLRLPGMSADVPITVPELQELLACPQRFLLIHGLRFSPKRPLPIAHALGPEPHGRLLRRALAAFFAKHGEEFGKRERSLPAWEVLADAAARTVFANSMVPSLRAGAAVREQRDRLRRDARLFVSQDWCGGRPRRFLDVERPFSAVLPAGEVRLHVASVTHRLDEDRDRLLVRMLSTERCCPRSSEGPSPEQDLPVAVAALASGDQAQALGLSPSAATAYAGVQVPSERAYHDDFDELASAARAWLAMLGGLLAARAFPHTPREKDCHRCAFQTACGSRASARAASRLAVGAEPALGAFWALKSARAVGAPGSQGGASLT
ncbi:PD-(D/E)XK nuclease family protein [Chondromyces crocatus]|uniref:PD-(D/E)XK nuclease family protein n=1 Tax=Chondromyces crocatus TaxID=52 RepID=UPI00067B18F2|nr:PD-(D/E)XK nuclease family protein [Chondromyces crocatus]